MTIDLNFIIAYISLSFRDIDRDFAIANFVDKYKKSGIESE